MRCPYCELQERPLQELIILNVIKKVLSRITS
jgi:hypothetical protein